ncbi:hypothetical protein Pmani_031226 [Petrolisthes manimaculis]|uniref:Uncharacterized protein n=1 Tax=Petrolisthes manimaculis TaxID=1843537 RepID=A0AAE1NW42_9EUCA|nr:hypothetical protein Pmani_031226 [Petrolisthes manimaculis]
MKDSYQHNHYYDLHHELLFFLIDTGHSSSSLSYSVTSIMPTTFLGYGSRAWSDVALTSTSKDLLRSTVRQRLSVTFQATVRGETALEFVPSLPQVTHSQGVEIGRGRCNIPIRRRLEIAVFWTFQNSH